MPVIADMQRAKTFAWSIAIALPLAFLSACAPEPSLRVSGILATRDLYPGYVLKAADLEQRYYYVDVKAFTDPPVNEVLSPVDGVKEIKFAIGKKLKDRAPEGTLISYNTLDLPPQDQGTKNSGGVDNYTQIVCAACDIPANKRVTKTDLHTFLVNSRINPKDCVHTEAETIGRQYVFPVKQGQLLFNPEIANQIAAKYSNCQVVKADERIMPLSVIDFSEVVGDASPQAGSGQALVHSVPASVGWLCVYGLHPGHAVESANLMPVTKLLSINVGQHVPRILDEQ